MNPTLIIGSDPTPWALDNANYDDVAAQLSQAGTVLLPVAGPLNGSLVLSVPHAGSLALFPGPPGQGSHPGDNPPPAADPADATQPPPPAVLSLSSVTLYLPSVTGATQASPGYALGTHTDLPTLEQDIKAAMDNGTLLSVPLPLSAASMGGVLVLSGAALAFAVLCPATA